MIKKEVLGQEIWECSREEARSVWVEFPDDRHRIWTHEEVDAHMLSGPEEIQEMIDKKENQPGEYL